MNLWNQLIDYQVNGFGSWFQNYIKIGDFNTFYCNILTGKNIFLSSKKKTNGFTC